MSGKQVFAVIAAWLALGWMAQLGAAEGESGRHTRLTTDAAAERVMPGVVSSQHREVQMTTHPAGRLILWGCDDCPRGRGKDLWMSQKQGEVWSGPGKASMNLPGDESSPAFSADGYWLYYVSDRAAGFGGADLYRIYYASHRESFSVAENLGPSINSAGDEGAATANADGARVIFTSRGREGARGWDLFESRRKGGRMTPGVPIKSVNTAGDEFDPTLLANDAGLVFARADPRDSNTSSLWFAPRRGEGFGEPTRLGDAVNVSGHSVRGPAQDLTDPQVLLFTRSESAAGGAATDLYKIRYRIEPGQESSRAVDD